MFVCQSTGLNNLLVTAIVKYTVAALTSIELTVYACITISSPETIRRGSTNFVKVIVCIKRTPRRPEVEVN